MEEPVKVSPPLAAADLAARTARRAAQASPTTTAVLLPAEFSTRYREQFRDRLWLHGLFAAGIIYIIYVAFYFSTTTFRGYQAGQVEQQMSALGDSYTNAIQLKARYAVLQERQNLKYAALDCWKVVADNLPEGITLQRFGLGDGRTLSLSGTTTQDQIDSLFNFNTALKDAKLNGQPMFNLVEAPTWHQYQNNVTWTFSAQLQHSEKME
jgi:hypothetical protein